jgi:cell division protein FtsB
MAAATTAGTRTRRRAPAATPSLRGAQRSNIQWHRVGRVALLFTLGVIVLLYIRPVAHWVQQRSTAAHSQADLRDLRREHDRLEARLHQLSGTGSIEREARKMGMVRSGERPYVVEP